jgi:hypothetical protein
MDLCAAQIGKAINVYKVWGGKPHLKISLGRLKHRWENSIKTELGSVTDFCECGHEAPDSINAKNFLTN